MHKALSFQTKILIGFTMIFVILIASFSVYLYRYTSDVIIDTELKNLAPITQKISDQIDIFYRQIDNAALSYVTNKDAFDIIAELDYNYSAKTSDFIPLTYEKELATYLSAIYTSLPKVHKVIVFNPKYDDFFFIYINNSNNLSEIPQVYKKGNQSEDMFKVSELYSFSAPHPDYWSKAPEEVISVYRKFSNPHFSDFGMIEVQVLSKELDDICKIAQDNSSKEVLLFNKKGQLVFPLYSADQIDKKNELTSMYSMIAENGKTSGEITYNKEAILFSYYTSDYTDLTTLAIDKKITLLTKVNSSRNAIIIISLLILAAVLSVYYILVSRLTKPLKHLITTVKTVSLDNLALEIPHGGYDEFRLLNKSFDKMFTRLKDSINKEYEARIREMEANYSSLQAQMNPHFIYNTLSVISACCEENKNTVAIEMCQRLTEMLRYTASSPNSTVNLSDEIKHSVFYLELMKLHYDNSLNYEVHIPEGFNSIKTPKLTLQPFVENCINHGFNINLPPWNIIIDGNIVDEMEWEISIQDNGSGFPAAILGNLNKEISEYKRNIIAGNLIENLQIGGMGLLNTYARLAIHFGNEFFLYIENIDTGGSIIRFGIKHRLVEDIVQ